MAKVIVYLHDHEIIALNDLAQREYRSPKAQAALIIRRELEKLGMLLVEPPAQSNSAERVTDVHDKPIGIGG